MFLFFACACLLGGTESKDTPAKKQPTIQTIPKPDKGLSGKLDAKKAIEKGRLLILEFGEEMPPDTLDPETDLPVGGMGCEYDDEMQAYLSAYNAVMKEWLENNTPFPKDMVVEFSSSQPDIDTVYKVTYNSVKVKRGSEWKEVHSLVSQRLKIGVLAQRSMGVRVPASLKKGGPSYFLSVQTGGKDWSMSWSGDRSPPAKVKATMESILEIKPY